jgi:hypothetical protein
VEVKAPGTTHADGTHFMDLGVDLKPEEVPYQPWSKALAEQRQAGVHKDDPLARCMPSGVPRVETHGGHPFKIIQMSRELIILYETSTNDVFREVFTDRAPRRGPAPFRRDEDSDEISQPASFAA